MKRFPLVVLLDLQCSTKIEPMLFHWSLCKVAHFYETCRTAVFPASASLPSFAEVTGELKNHEGVQTSAFAHRVITYGVFFEKVKL